MCVRMHVVVCIPPLFACFLISQLTVKKICTYVMVMLTSGERKKTRANIDKQLVFFLSPSFEQYATVDDQCFADTSLLYLILVLVHLTICTPPNHSNASLL